MPPGGYRCAGLAPCFARPGAGAFACALAARLTAGFSADVPAAFPAVFPAVFPAAFPAALAGTWRYVVLPSAALRAFT
ncbi:protein of unknown function [Cupriavidus taiwanensis]|uniref:Uncharacterized protein n=1 Tax=Cupriavidus taiwanensis TaxID=164546 RepID=A0A7Z7J752_9BURK|nr:conserved protein of unknown function [Cupriavidus taiwanensis]SOZ02196.1 conserved hypothetical protein [Cupriavidus taiwanensis]SOZ05185.1 conserved hypothetical protein [Cupriavidus taiwanensis]SPC09667.1 conserved hypothetical protein [Cupriavidus taiwanensis]SPD39454.1 protein of unknown function [Cupriavidus taiwanensis]